MTYVLNMIHICPNIANSHRRANHIRNIEVDGVLYDDESTIQSQVVQFYQNIYTEMDTWRPTMDGLDFACIGEDERLPSF